MGCLAAGATPQATECLAGMHCSSDAASGFATIFSTISLSATVGKPTGNDLREGKSVALLPLALDRETPDATR